MKFFMRREKITPDIPVFQAGFAARTHKSEGIHDDPYVTVLIISANKTAIIIALDVVDGDRSFAYGIKKAIWEKYGLEQDEIIINYSHTHSVVAVTGEDEEKRSFQPYSISWDGLSGDGDKDKNVDLREDIRYFKAIRKKIMELLDKGFENMIEADAYICKSTSKFGVSRRFPAGNGVLWKPYFEENAVDTDLYLIKFIDKSNCMRGLIYNYACHPSTLGSDNYLISADFPGVVRKHLESHYPGMTAVFLQGCGADIKPYITADNGRFKSCGYDELEQAGISLAKEIQGCIDKSGWRKIDTEIKTGYSDMKLYVEVWNVRKWVDIVNDPDQPSYIKVAAKKILGDIKEGKAKNHLPYYMSILRLDKKACIIGLECEVISDIGKNIKKVLSDEDVIVLGYSNSSVCYIPTGKVLQEGGYESASFISAGLAGPFVQEVEDIILGRAIAMAKCRSS